MIKSKKEVKRGKASSSLNHRAINDQHHIKTGKSPHSLNYSQLSVKIGLVIVILMIGLFLFYADILFSSNSLQDRAGIDAKASMDRGDSDKEDKARIITAQSFKDAQRQPIRSNECMDSIDNDYDGLVDLEDSGCTSQTGDKEARDSDSWWGYKGIYSIDSYVNPSNAANELIERLNNAAEYGFNVVQIYDFSYAKILLNGSNSAGQTLRDNNMKAWVPLGCHGGVLYRYVDASAATLEFVASGWYRFNSFKDHWYHDASDKSFMLDDEEICFSHWTEDNVTIGPHRRYKFTFHNVVRGCHGTTPEPHAVGSIPVNEDCMEKMLSYYTIPEMQDAVSGYYCIDDAPITYFTVDYRGMQKNKHEIIRRYDPDPSRPIIYAQMAFPLDTWWLVPGTTNFTYVDKIAMYIYPWRENFHLLNRLVNNTNWNRIFAQQAGKDVEVIPVGQTFGLGNIYRFPTEEELRTEIALHRDLGAENIMFYGYRFLMNNTEQHEMELTDENWGAAIKDVPLGPLSACFDYIVNGDAVTLDAGCSLPGEGPILSYEWDLGDGASVQGEVVEYRYTSTHPVNITLTISNHYLDESDSITEKDVKLGYRMHCKADMNRDGIVTFGDITPFNLFMEDHNARYFWYADVDDDGFVDDRDTNELIAILNGKKNTTCVDYVPFKKIAAPIPPDQNVIKGDMNQDGKISFDDINPFLDFYRNHNKELFWYADIDNNKFVDANDLNGFTDILVGNLSSSCNKGEGPEQEKCDGIDNDCDGLVDEDFPRGCPSKNMEIVRVI